MIFLVYILGVLTKLLLNNVQGDHAFVDLIPLGYLFENLLRSLYLARLNKPPRRLSEEESANGATQLHQKAKANEPDPVLGDKYEV